MIKDLALPPVERIYRSNYLLPYFSLTMEPKPSVERVSKALAIPLHYDEIEQVWRVAISAIPHVLAIAKWSLRHLTPESEKAIAAKMVLNAFKEEKAITLTPEEVKEIWGLTTKEKYGWLKKKRKIP